MENANLYALFEKNFPDDRSANSIETPDGQHWSYGDLERIVGGYAAQLRDLGVKQGDRVAVQVDKSPYALFVYLACLRAKFVYLPLNTAYPKRELAYFISDAEPSAVVCRPEALEGVEQLARTHGVSNVLSLDADGSGSLSLEGDGDFETVQAAPDDIAAILYTSGTTGKPKGAMLSHRNLSSNAEVLHRTWRFQSDDVLLHALPLFHTHGLFVACHTTLLNGTPMLFCPKFEVDTVKRLLPRATVFMGVPTFYVRLLADPDFGAEHCENMRLFISGSAPLLTQTFYEFRARTGHTILERYGMTECGMSTSNPYDGQRKPGTVGRPLDGISLRVVDGADSTLPAGEIGQIQFTGPNVFKGYWKNPEKTAEEFTRDGYFRSGDLGAIDEDGYVSISGRDKDLIITGGYNVYPKEVESCIDELDGIVESAVIGLPHPDFGEQVTAVVVRQPGPAAMEDNEILNNLRQSLASYKVPKRLMFVDALPRNAMGKVQKNLLRERFAKKEN